MGRVDVDALNSNKSLRCRLKHGIVRHDLKSPLSGCIGGIASTVSPATMGIALLVATHVIAALFCSSTNGSLHKHTVDAR